MKSTLIILLLIVCTLAYGCGPCAFVTDQKACYSAYANAPRLPMVKIGMTPDEVQKALGGRQPDRRDANVESETWYYMSDYERELMARYTFTNGHLTKIDTVSWESK